MQKQNRGSYEGAYYGVFPYSIEDNYLNMKANPLAPEWETSSQAEQAMVYATQNIVIPAGITSIDAKSYFLDGNGLLNTANSRNFNVYFRTDGPYRDVYQMITGDKVPDYDGTIKIQPGLFSGYYEDYKGGSDFETHIRGNDQIVSVTMYTVESLPDYAFDSCEQLEVANLGAVKELGTYTFCVVTQILAV
jgi:hypothetical protein